MVHMMVSFSKHLEMYWDTFWSQLVEYVHFGSSQGLMMYFFLFAPLIFFHSFHNIMQIGFNDNFQITLILNWQETRQMPFSFTSFPFITKHFLEIKGFFIRKYTYSAMDSCYGNKI